METKNFIKFAKVIAKWSKECNVEREVADKTVADAIDNSEKMFFEKASVKAECDIECMMKKREIILTCANVKDGIFYHSRTIISFIKNYGIKITYVNLNGERFDDYEKSLFIKKVEDIKKEKIN